MTRITLAALVLLHSLTAHGDIDDQRNNKVVKDLENFVLKIVEKSDTPRTLRYKYTVVVDLIDKNTADEATDYNLFPAGRQTKKEQSFVHELTVNKTTLKHSTIDSASNVCDECILENNRFTRTAGNRYKQTKKVSDNRDIIMTTHILSWNGILQFMKEGDTEFSVQDDTVILKTVVNRESGIFAYTLQTVPFNGEYVPSCYRMQSGNSEVVHVYSDYVAVNGIAIPGKIEIENMEKDATRKPSGVDNPSPRMPATKRVYELLQ